MSAIRYFNVTSTERTNLGQIASKKLGDDVERNIFGYDMLLEVKISILDCFSFDSSRNLLFDAVALKLWLVLKHASGNAARDTVMVFFL